MNSSPASTPRLVASRYNIFVPLRGGRKLAYNSLSGSLAI